MGRYQVVGEVAHVRTNTASGRQTLMLPKGAMVPADAPAEQIAHLLSVKLIKAVDGVPAPTPAPDPAESEPAGPIDSVPYDDPDRVAARQKLPDNGGLPHPNAGHPVWVEAAVAAGYAYDAAVKEDKQSLIELLRK
jgi:hypothetical protein